MEKQNAIKDICSHTYVCRKFKPKKRFVKEQITKLTDVICEMLCPSICKWMMPCKRIVDMHHLRNQVLTIRLWRLFFRLFRHGFFSVYLGMFFFAIPFLSIYTCFFFSCNQRAGCVSLSRICSFSRSTRFFPFVFTFCSEVYVIYRGQYVHYVEVLRLS